MRVVVATTNGEVALESTGRYAVETGRFVYNWIRWTAGETPDSSGLLSHDGGAPRIDYRDVLGVEIVR